MTGEREQELAGQLEELLRANGLDGAVEGLRRLSGGASRETWSFDLVAGEERHGLILQRVRGKLSGTGPGVQGEAALMRAAEAQGVPVPAVVADDDGSVLGGPSMVTRRLDGETIARKLLRDEEWATARSRLVRQAGAALAAIHRIDPSALPEAAPVDPLEQLYGLLDGFGQPLPAFELGLRYLEANRPPDADPLVVHGDFRLGNLMVDREGLAGVLDWELAHVGNPVEDLGWYCVRAWRFGSPLPAGGMGSREELLEAYEAAGGRHVDPEELRWWELWGTVRWGLICVMQARTHLDGIARSVELATIGRRVCENEWDVLGLLPGEPLPDAATSAEPVADSGLYGRPTAGELLEAIREWVEGDVMAGTEGRLAFHARVTANALRMLERQAALGPAHEAAHRARLDALGHEDDASLSAAIRAGEEDHRWEEVRQAVAASVRAKLEVANPRWLEAD